MGNGVFSTIRKGGVLSIVAILALFLSIFSFYQNNTALFEFSGWARQDWFAFLELLVILISAIIAFIAIFHNKKVVRERATLDIILDDYKDEKMYEAKSILYEYLQVKDGSQKTLVSIYDSAEISEEEKKIKSALLLVMNRNEFYAMGINSGLLDENVFKRTHCSNVLKLWDAISPTVMSIREKEQKATLFKDLEILANRWKMNPLTTENIK